ncbi:hypothetical protein GCM10009682_41350 [Luedemannella flava]|uniref:DUF4383 domain-containing protein n=1 Tax=Luedemannella flava TaxID=349316 RepID=A0ABN2MCM7_9ACTN
MTLHRVATYRNYCRAAAVAFGLYTAYPVVVKIAEDRLAHDWAHSALHLLSALFAAYAGWLAATELPAKLFTWGIGALYGVLGIVGWFIDGLFLTTHLAIPLGPPDNVFHLVIAVPAVVVSAASAK